MPRCAINIGGKLSLAWWTRPAWRILAADETLPGGATRGVTREGLVMSLTKSAPGLLWRFALVTRSFLAHEGLPFADAVRPCCKRPCGASARLGS